MRVRSELATAALGARTSVRGSAEVNSLSRVFVSSDSLLGPGSPSVCYGVDPAGHANPLAEIRISCLSRYGLITRRSRCEDADSNHEHAGASRGEATVAESLRGAAGSGLPEGPDSVFPGRDLTTFGRRVGPPEDPGIFGLA